MAAFARDADPGRAALARFNEAATRAKAGDGPGAIAVWDDLARRGDHGALMEVNRAPHRTRDHRQDTGASGGVDEVDHVDHEGGVLDDRVQESAPSPPLATSWQGRCVLGE
jgi:hypothetical protein